MADYFDKLFNEATMDGISMILRCRAGYNLSLELDGNEYYCHKLERPRKLNNAINGDNWLCIRVSALPKSGKATIKVAEAYASRVIGKNASVIKKIAKDLGMPKENIVIAENGSVIELSKEGINVAGKIQSGKVLVDGLGVGDVGNIVLRDRRLLSQDGIMIVVVTIDHETYQVVSGPDIVSRGFVYVREAEDLMEEAREKVLSALDRCETNGVTEWSMIKSAIRDSLGRFLYERTRRRPMILPIIMEI